MDVHHVTDASLQHRNAERLLPLDKGNMGDQPRIEHLIYSVRVVAPATRLAPDPSAFACISSVHHLS